MGSTMMSDLPRVSYIKAIDIWIIACILFVITALIEFAVASTRIRKQQQENWQYEVRSLIRQELIRCGIECEADRTNAIGDYNRKYTTLTLTTKNRSMPSPHQNSAYPRNPIHTSSGCYPPNCYPPGHPGYSQQINASGNHGFNSFARDQYNHQSYYPYGGQTYLPSSGTVHQRGQTPDENSEELETLLATQMDQDYRHYQQQQSVMGHCGGGNTNQQSHGMPVMELEKVSIPMPTNLPSVPTESNIDAYSRFLFPACFLLYNCFYWLYYLVIVQDLNDEMFAESPAVNKTLI